MLRTFDPRIIHFYTNALFVSIFLKPEEAGQGGSVQHGEIALRCLFYTFSHQVYKLSLLQHIYLHSIGCDSVKFTGNLPQNAFTATRHMETGLLVSVIELHVEEQVTILIHVFPYSQMLDIDLHEYNREQSPIKSY
ncbi:Hypothetical predicted protein [Scomber scombrus]|uniref:Uncharacterized protein n=1 Tax=Scomber scombrus TaxID=13677 RepID=A0AAV1PWE4_SCOSC